MAFDRSKTRKQLCDAGVARIVLGTVAAESPELLKEFVDRFSSRICVGIDARDGRVMTRGWETATPLMAVDLARAVAACGVERIIYTDIARDGMLSGPNIEQTLAVVRAANVRVTASGGVSSLDDIKRLRDADEPRLDSVIVGKALYEGKFKLEEAMQAVRRTLKIMSEKIFADGILNGHVGVRHRWWHGYHGRRRACACRIGRECRACEPEVGALATGG